LTGNCKGFAADKLSWQKESRKCTRREGTRFIDGISDRMGGK